MLEIFSTEGCDVPSLTLVRDINAAIKAVVNRKELTVGAALANLQYNATERAEVTRWFRETHGVIV